MMNEVTGLIELESDEYTSIDNLAGCDDATLGELFARLVGQQGHSRIHADGFHREVPRVMTANLEALAEDLHVATRDLLANLFLSLGRR